MIDISLLFWLALAIPGYAAVCHFDRDQLKSGLLGTLGLSYLATFGLLSPISILCYVLRLPVSVFGVCCALLVIAGGIEITRKRWWRDAWGLALGALGFELLILVADLAWGARVGSLLTGDSYIHLARIRHLLDHGLTNDDPFVAGGHFFSIYHTNLLHALHAACAWITRVDYLSAWYASLPLAKLLLACGCYYLAWCVFRRQWVAWVAVVFFVGMHGPMPHVGFPNRIAPFFVMPMLLGLAIQFCCSRCTGRQVCAFVVGLLVLEQIHGVYALFAVGLFGPVFLAVAAFKLIRKHRDRWLQVVCLAVLPFALASPLVTKLTTVTKAPPVVGGPVESRFGHTAKDAANFIRLDNGWLMLNPLRGFGVHAGLAHCLLVGGVIGALCTDRRREVGFAAAVVLTGAATLYVPPICSGVLAAIGHQWILIRLQFILYIGLAVLVPTTVTYLLATKLRAWPLRATLCIGAFWAGTAFCMGDDHTWPAYLRKGQNPNAKRHDQLDSLRRVRGFLHKHIPPGETVLVEEALGLLVVMLHDCHIVAPQRGTVSVTDLARRLRHTKQMLALTTSAQRRWLLIRKYGIRYYVPSEVASWVKGHVRNSWHLKKKGKEDKKKGKIDIWVIKLAGD